MSEEAKPEAPTELAEKVKEVAGAQISNTEDITSKGEESIEEQTKKMKMQNDALEQEISRNEVLRAKLLIGGRTMAGKSEQTQEQKDAEAAAKLYKGFM